MKAKKTVSETFGPRSLARRLVCVRVLSSVLLILPSALLAVEESEVGGHGYGEGALLAGLEGANITMALIASVLFFVVARRLAASREGVAVGYLMTGIALLGMTRVFYIVADRGLISVHDDTLELWWHLIFYQAMLMCIWGGKVLSAIPSEGDWLNSVRTLRRWQVVSAVLTVAVFLTADVLDEPFVTAFDGTLWDRLGVQHFAAFILAALAVLQMVATVRNPETLSGGDIVGRLKVPLVCTYGLFSVDHFWELLTESWEVFVFPETMIERTEQMIVFPALLAAIYAGWRLWTHRPPKLP